MDLVKVDSMAYLKVEGDTPLFQTYKKRFTLSIRNVDESYTKLKLYKLVKDKKGNLYMKIPRAYCNKAMDLEVLPNWKRRPIKFEGKLKDFQKDIVNNVMQDFISGSYGGIVKAGTGTGKTVMAIAFMCQTNLRTVIIVPLERIVNQWKERLLEFTNLTEKDIGYIHQNRTDYEKKKVVIAMLPSLASRLGNYPKPMYEYFGLSIWDEGHVLGAKTFSQVIPLFKDCYRLMLSATPRRKDGAENVFKYHIGNIIAEYNHTMLTPLVYSVQYHDRDTMMFRFKGAKDMYIRAKWLKAIATNEERNKLIIELILKCLKSDRKILVISDRIVQLKLIGNELKSMGISFGRAYSNYKEYLNTVILATYGSLGMAVDLPQLDTLIMATPRVDIEQVVGRILREADNKKFPVVFDIVDTANDDAVKRANSREKFYRSKGFKIKTLKKIIRR